MSPLFLLDTNIVSNLRMVRPHPALIAWLQSVPPESIFMAAATISEIQCGIGMVADRTVAANVQQWLDGMLRDGQPRIADFDTRAAVLLGRMWAAPSLDNFIANDPRSRKSKSGADLAIAATAIARDMIVVTANVADFLDIHATFPLPGLFNPFNATWAIESATV